VRQRPRGRIGARTALCGGGGLAAIGGWFFLVVAGSFGAPDGVGLAGGCAGGGWVVVAATVYETGTVGAYGVPLAGRLAYAELGLPFPSDQNPADAERLGRALGLGGPLPPFAKLLVRAPSGRTVEAEKLDVGFGGPPIDGKPRAIDLWLETRRALGLPPRWSGLLEVALPAATQESCAQPQPTTALEARIVAIARSQLGVASRPPGSECNPYGPCEPWCSLFATWVWRQAGVAVPTLPFSGALFSWAQSRGLAYPPTATPQPGWAVFFGSGPENPSTSLHVALVEAVYGGRITLINGNFAGQVARSGPCLPAQAQSGCAEPGPIYGYAAP